MREGIYEAIVISFDATSGIVRCTIPSLFGQQPQVLRPSLPRAGDVSRIAPVAAGDRVMAFSPGSDDSPWKWHPTIRDAAFDSYYTSFFDARYDPRYVDVAGDTMTGKLKINVGNANALRFVTDGSYIDWYNAAESTRTGYLQANGASGLILNSEAGQLNLQGYSSFGWGAGNKVVFNSSSLYVGNWVQANGYNGLMYGSQYLLMTNGGDTFVTAPADGGTVYLRSGVNGPYELAIKDTGVNAMIGSLDLIGYYVNASQYYFQNTGYVFHHNTDQDTGIYYDSDGHYRLIANGTSPLSVFPGGLSTNQGTIRLVSEGDSNHELVYIGGAVPSGSGEASNGPILRGYSSVWLRSQTGGDLYLSSAGNLFLSATKVYANFSSRKMKENIVDLDPFECRRQVMAWRPRGFNWLEKYDPTLSYDTGYIAEEMAEVTPTAVVYATDISENAGDPIALDYSSLTAQLGGGYQAHDIMIEDLSKTLTAALGEIRELRAMVDARG